MPTPTWSTGPIWAGPASRDGGDTGAEPVVQQTAGDSRQQVYEGPDNGLPENRLHLRQRRRVRDSGQGEGQPQLVADGLRWRNGLDGDRPAAGHWALKLDKGIPKAGIGAGGQL